jgi:hypothetical protein
MQGAAGEAAVRQTRIKCRNAEGQGWTPILRHAWQEAAKVFHDGRAVARCERGEKRHLSSFDSHLACVERV